MVKRKKHDKDKYYSLARQQGYRARSAFKLIQLNKKYDFLSNAKVCIDLCAAPGGWCQVAAKYMPSSSIILGIDLLPIRPIRNVKTFQCDITTQRCRQIIRQELQTWQADVVLCDGAPNVGAEYSKDAFVQNELALIALKLAVDVMGKGGTFVTKVFRSQDYNALLWVFKQLFKTVSATKPLSSRNESAEIFVVCENYLAPNSIDPKLLDAKYVFSQLEQEQSDVTIFHPKYGQRKRQRQGYDEALGMTLTKECTVSQFLDNADPIRLLTDATKIYFAEEDDVYKEHSASTPEIVECIRDLKVLGKSDFKSILKWRTKLMDYRNELLKQDEPEEEVVDEVKEEVIKTTEELQKEKDQAVREELALARANLAAKEKRKLKKDRERKAKLRLRAAMGMDINAMEIAQDEEIFDIKKLGLQKDAADTLLDKGVTHDDESSDEEEDTLEIDEENLDQFVDMQLDSMYDDYLTRKKKGDGFAVASSQAKRSKLAKRALAGEAVAADAALYDGDAQQYAELLRPEVSSDSEEEEDEALAVDSDRLVRQSDEKEAVVADRWFGGNSLFAEVENSASENSSDDASDEEVDTMLDEDGDLVPRMPLTEKEKRHAKRKGAIERMERRDAKRQKQLEADERAFEVADENEKTKSNKSEEAEEENSDEEGRPMSQEAKDLIKAGIGEAALKKEKKHDNHGFEVVDQRKYDSENEDFDLDDRARTLALGTMMVCGGRSKAKELTDSSYNRYAWNDEADLPDWFVDDERRNYRPQVEIPKHLMDSMKEKFIEMASKPLKKVAEARMRKKKREVAKLQAAKKKATDIANLPDLSNREKIKAIEKTMKKTKAKTPNKVMVVSTRGGRRSSKDARKKGMKNGVKLVDPRLKADKRGAESKKNKKKGRSRR